MPTGLALQVHTGAIAAATDRMLDAYALAGGVATVPTCPAWTADKLVAHQAMVHRWAAANVRGEDAAVPITQTRILAETEDLPGYLREGSVALLAAIEAADDDLQAMAFLNEAPPPRLFWARRQAHETTIHAVDALAAALGRLPTAAEAAIPTDLATDGLDEFLRGFLTRGAKHSPLFDGEEFTFTVRPTDSEACWSARVAEGPLVTTVGDGGSTDATLTGTSAQLYLGLWNRGAEIVETGQRALLARWKDVRVQWH